MPWIALLDDDEDDFTFWHYGVQTWAQPVVLNWFKSAEFFLAEAAQKESKPMAIILDGIVPEDDQERWLTTFLGHVCCQNIPIFILTGQFNQSEKERFLELGATDYLLKPSTTQELHNLIQQVIKP